MAPRRKPSGVPLRNGRSMTPAIPLAINNVLDHPTTFLGNEAQILIKCNQKLKELGIEGTIKVPQISVVGDQSTGKSSLIEQISKIQVPKAAGCCTQCPIAINLSSGHETSSAWICTVYIEKKYDYVASMAKVTKTNPFGPWQKRTTTELIALPVTGNKEDVPHLIRVAQAAILDPGRGPAYYLSSPEALQDATQVARFSPNVIRLDISEGDMPNLSFIDLPGVIANTGRAQDKYLVTLIRNLVQEYARDQRSINMLTLPMNHDIDNCQALAIIQELQVEDRTLAVFTKSDLASEEQINQFMGRFSGENDEIAFQHGYHSVMMPDKMSLEQVDVYEKEKYNQKPWYDLPQDLKDRLGVSSLSNHLRQLLFEKTAEALPGNLNAIKARLHEVQSELSRLPEPLDNSELPWKLRDEVKNFDREITELFRAAATHREWNDMCMNFRNQVSNGRPTLVVSTQAELTCLTQCLSVFEDNTAEHSRETSGASSARVKTDAPIMANTVNKKVGAHKFRLEEIRRTNADVYSAFTQGEIDPKAVDLMNKRSVDWWNTVLSDHLDACRIMLCGQVLSCFDEMFAGIQHLKVHTIMRDCVSSHVEEALVIERGYAMAVCHREQQRPFTLDSDLLKAKEKIILDSLSKRRQEFRVRLLKAELDAEEHVKRPKRDPVKDGLLEDDPYNKEVEMAAKNRAYYEIAASRFTDVIGQSIFHNLLSQCTAPLLRALSDCLGTENTSRHPQIIEWMEANPELEATRRRLLREEKSLIDGHAYINEALGSHNGGTPSPSKRRLSHGQHPSESDNSPSKKTRVDGDNGSQAEWAQPMEGVETDDMTD